MTAQEFYEAHKTNIVNVPRVGHPEDKSGWDGEDTDEEALCDHCDGDDDEFDDEEML